MTKIPSSLFYVFKSAGINPSYWKQYVNRYRVQELIGALFLSEIGLCVSAVVFQTSSIAKGPTRGFNWTCHDRFIGLFRATYTRTGHKCEPLYHVDISRRLKFVLWC